VTALKRGLWAFLILFSAKALAFDYPDIVRVKFLSLNFPISIEGQGISIKGVSSPHIKNISIPTQSKFEIDQKQIGRHKIWFVRKDQNTDRLTRKYIEITSTDSKIKISGFDVPTPVLVAPSGDIISALPIDSYLEGVLAGEMPLNWPMEALKAQVVAARTYTLFQMDQRDRELYHVQAGILDQAYSSAITPAQRARVKSAIDLTHHMVMTRYGEIIKAYYHADCGGQTEDPDYVWGRSKKRHNLQSVTDPQCALNPQSKWDLEIPLAEILEKLDSRSSGALKNIKSVRVVSRTPSGRVAVLAFSGSNNKQVLISGNDLRGLVGYMKLKSTSFEVEIVNGAVNFTGRGFGHGSGLCQNGAKFLAEKGALVKDILKHYYPAVSFSEVHVADR
jgi:stage II sporulation protein D